MKFFVISANCKKLVNALLNYFLGFLFPGQCFPFISFGKKMCFEMILWISINHTLKFQGPTSRFIYLWQDFNRILQDFGDFHYRFEGDGIPTRDYTL